jgi:hypothetical protein
MNTLPWLDGSLYPEGAIPDALESPADRVDFPARLCSAWDFGILPNSDTVAEIRNPEWIPAVQACRLLTSPAYHLVRRWRHLSSLPYLGGQIASIRDDPYLSRV